jgi:localization factor PodJL
MKPGIPWSVKGIEQQARAAAKQAARQSGMTIGEWLNSVILESADGNDDLERRYRRPPYRPRQAPGAEQGDGEEVTLRLEEIADQLHNMARHDSDTALTRPMAPEDETQLRAIIERLDAHEQNTSSALGAMQERLEQVSQRLGGEASHAAPQRPDDVPGYRALEGALRNIIEHIEISETRTRDSIRSLQERLTQPAGGMGLGQLEQRVEELAGRLADEPNDLSEVQQAEQRLRGLVEEARHASGALDPNEGLAQLRLEMEQLAATVSQGSGHALADLGSRLEQLEADTRRRFSERDQETQSEVAALGQRIAATEKRLEHLATIEESVAQLARSLEADRGEAGDSGHADGPSPELRALEEGLKAVRASAEVSDRRTQETLQAVHETLEQIVGKLAELEAEDGPDDAAMDDGPAAEVTEDPAEALADEQASELAEELAEEPSEELAQESANEDSFSYSQSETPMDEAESETDDTTAMEAAAEGFVFPEAPAPEETDPEPTDEPQVAAYDEPAAEPHAPADPSDPPVREDYIAAARRAAQMAASRKNPVTSGFNKFSQRMSGGGAKSADTTETRTQKRGFVASLLGGLRGRKAKSGDNAQPGDDAQPGGKKSKRKRLIFAGLVLLAAVSAYGAQRNIDSLPDFDLIGGAFSSFPLGQTGAGPEAFSGMWPLGALTTASVTPPTRSANERSAVASATLPDEIGPQSLRQAAIGGDAVAQFVVAGRYLDGKAVTRDEALAAQWYERAARQGLAAAQYRLGSMYEHGRGRPVDRDQAVALYEQAAASGNINAMHNLAVLKTDASGQRDYVLAASWFRKAAERGLRDSQFNLAVLHEQGLGVPKNPADAVFWYSLAAVHGDGEAADKAKALEATLAPDAAKQVRTRLMGWRALPADRKANAVPVDDPSWQELS